MSEMFLLFTIFGITEASHFLLPKLEVPKDVVKPMWKATSICADLNLETHHFTTENFLAPRCHNIEYYYSILRVHIECATEDGEGDTCPEEKANLACGPGGPCDLNAVYVTAYSDFALEGMKTGPGTHKWDMRPASESNRHNDYRFFKEWKDDASSYDLLQKNDPFMLPEKCGILVVNFEENRPIGIKGQADSSGSTESAPSVFYISLDLRKETCSDLHPTVTDKHATEPPFDPNVHIRTHCALASDLGSNFGQARICLTILHFTTWVKWPATYGLMISRKANMTIAPEKLAENRLKGVSTVDQGSFKVITGDSELEQNPIENYRCGRALYYYGVISMRLVCQGEPNGVCSKKCTQELCDDGFRDDSYHCDSRVDIENLHSYSSLYHTAWHLQNQADPATYKDYFGRGSQKLVQRHLTGKISHENTQHFALADSDFNAQNMKECATFKTEILDEDQANMDDQSTVYFHQKLLKPNKPITKIPLPRFSNYDPQIYHEPVLGYPFLYLQNHTTKAQCNGEDIQAEVSHVILLLSITEPDGARVCNDDVTAHFFNCTEQRVYDTTKAEAWLRRTLSTEVFNGDKEFKVTIDKKTSHQPAWTDYRGVETL